MGTLVITERRPHASKSMNADQARELARKNIKGPVIQPWMDYIHEAITAAAKDGRFSINHPFHDRRSDVGRSAPQYPNADMIAAIKRNFENEGFTWTDHPDPDPGDPRGGPYTEISWR